ncbi:MAG: type II toxin-antitoxin system VapC family toxin [Terriglobia bacterium]
MAIDSCLVDTNILLRVSRRSDPQHKLVDAALARLAGQGTTLHYTHQNIAELWNAMTRPAARNGLGLSASDAECEVRAIEAGMSLLPDSEAVYREWRRIVVQYGVWGVQVSLTSGRFANKQRSVAGGRNPFPLRMAGPRLAGLKLLKLA